MAMHLGEATIGTGASGAEVKTIQQILQGQGYNVGPIDGVFGEQTKAAVVSFQKAKGLLPDGIVGPLTWEKMQGAPVQPAPMPEKVAVQAPDSGMGTFGTIAILGIAGLVLMSMIGKK